MHALTLLLAAAVAQVGGPAPENVAAIRDHLSLVADGAGHYLAFDPEEPYRTLFTGDGKTFYRVRSPGGGKNGDESFDVSLWDPRIARGTSDSRAEFQMKDSGKRYVLTCGAHDTDFKPVPAAEARALLDKATFFKPRWQRLPERLLRDDRGTYYLVDRLRTEDALDRRDFRLFIGPRGAMKLQPLKDVVDDSEGMIFSTRNGELRLVANRGGDGQGEGKSPPLKWVKGKKELPLVDVPLDNQRNARLVYMELGVYAGQRLGTPCDELM